MFLTKLRGPSLSLREFPSVPRPIADLVKSMLAREANDRPSAKQVAEALARLQQGPVALVRSPLFHLAGSPSAPRVLGSLLLFLLVGGIAAGYLILLDPNRDRKSPASLAASAPPPRMDPIRRHRERTRSGRIKPILPAQTPLS